MWTDGSGEDVTEFYRKAVGAVSITDSEPGSTAAC
jgi:hypothetical protein